MARDRLFPAYTTRELEAIVARFDEGKFTFSSAEMIDQIRAEITARPHRSKGLTACLPYWVQAIAD